MDDDKEYFWHMALGGPALFYEGLCPEEELAARFASWDDNTARDFVVLRTLAEVQKYGAICKRWQRNLDISDSFEELTREAADVERAAWHRRLLEGLVNLINFADTNEHCYYAHFLAVAECERLQLRLADEKEFFGAECNLTKAQTDSMKFRVDEISNKLPERRQDWCVQPGKPYRGSSFRSRYKRALLLAKPAERIALSYTCDLSFGCASELLHFSVLDKSKETENSNQSYTTISTLLAASIIVRAHQLCRIEPKGINKSVVRQLESDVALSSRLLGDARVGDFVLSSGPQVGEVVEVTRNSYGYALYRVEFIATVVHPGSEEAWLPAAIVTKFLERDEMLVMMKERLTAAGYDGQGESSLDFRQLLRESVAEAWHRGLSEYVMAKSKDA